MADDWWLNKDLRVISNPRHGQKEGSLCGTVCARDLKRICSQATLAGHNHACVRNGTRKAQAAGQNLQ